MTKQKSDYLKEYRANEEMNAHTENYLLLAELFGCNFQVIEVKLIMQKRDKLGHIPKEDSDWLYVNINPYYKKLIA